jgi:hypothetical protein
MHRKCRTQPALDSLRVPKAEVEAPGLWKVVRLLPPSATVLHRSDVRGGVNGRLRMIFDGYSQLST